MRQSHRRAPLLPSTGHFLLGERLRFTSTSECWWRVNHFRWRRGNARQRKKGLLLDLGEGAGTDSIPNEAVLQSFFLLILLGRSLTFFRKIHYHFCFIFIKMAIFNYYVLCFGGYAPQLQSSGIACSHCPRSSRVHGTSWVVAFWGDGDIETDLNGRPCDGPAIIWSITNM